MPVVPDANMLNDSYTYHRGNVYMDKDVSLARCVLVEYECRISFRRLHCKKVIDREALYPTYPGYQH